VGGPKYIADADTLNNRMIEGVNGNSNKFEEFSRKDLLIIR